MTTKIRLLALLLAAQLVLAVVLLWEDTGVRGPDVGQPLLSFDVTAVDEIQIGSAEHEVILKKTVDAWRLPALADFPADQGKVSQLINRLQMLTTGHPLAASTEAAERFKVAEQAFVRRIRLKQGDAVLAELYLGETSGVRRVYGRAAGSAQIYPLTFALHQAGAQSSDWWDKNYLHREAESLQAIELGAIRLEKADGGWTMAGLTDSEPADAKVVADLAGRLSRLSYQEVTIDRQRLQGTVLLRLAFDGSDGRVEYLFRDVGQDADPMLTITGRPHGLRIARYEFDELREMEGNYR